MTFELGQTLMTCGIRDIIDSSPEAAWVFNECLFRHSNGDWGDLCEEDRQMNDDALAAEKNGGYTDSLFSAYKTGFGKIYIITECDRSVTTILLPEEY